jgi:superfamily II DNA or RNA helicase
VTILIIGNRVTQVQEPTLRVVKVLEKTCSYRVEGYMFSPAWRARVWDGREHLMKFSRSSGYTLPTGLAVSVARTLKKIGEPFTVKDRTVVRNKRQPFELISPDPTRGYQEEAIAEMLSSPFPGRGILKSPVRSGKTRMGGEMIARIGLPTIMTVPSKSLLHQTYDSFSSYFPNMTIGRIGDGFYEPRYITVATMQTLLKMRGREAVKKKGKKKAKPAIPRDARYDELMTMFDVNINDEIHRLKGTGSWHEVAYEIDARYKIGLSATVYLDNDTEQSRGAIWMIATHGPMRVDIPVSRLVSEGFLMRQNVEIHKVRIPDFRGAGWSTTMRQRCIDTNSSRNRLIARLARDKVDQGLRVLVIARHREHISLLHEELEGVGLTVAVVHGNTTQSRREQAADDLSDGSVDVVVGNVFGEGIDLPAVEVVINAEGGKGDIQTVQRQRNLTISKGKKKAILIDFIDLTNETLEEHSLARLAMYRSEPSFKVRVY